MQIVNRTIIEYVIKFWCTIRNQTNMGSLTRVPTQLPMFGQMELLPYNMALYKSAYKLYELISIMNKNRYLVRW